MSGRLFLRARSCHSRDRICGLKSGSLFAALAVIALFVLADLLAPMPALASGAPGGTASITISQPSPPEGPTGTNVVVSGANWQSGTSVTLEIAGSDGTCASATSIPNGATGTANTNGDVQIAFAWPSLAAGSYHICAFGPSGGGVLSDNTFDELSQSAPSISLPSSAASGAKVTFSGTGWLPGGSNVEVLGGTSGNGCQQSLAAVTSNNDGSLSGSFTAPTVTAQTTLTVVAVSPAHTCSGSVAPTLRVTATIAITPARSTGGGTPGGSTSTGGGNSTGNGSGTGGKGGGSGSGHCSPLPDALCSSPLGLPWWVICLTLLILLLLLLLLFILLMRRQNSEVVVTEEDITSEIDPAGVQPMGAMRYMRSVRVTTQRVDRRTGQVRSSRVQIFDEFSDAQGNTHRRQRR